MLVPYLRAWRDSRTLTQDELAVRAGVTRNTVIRAEADLDVRQSTVRKLARGLGITPARLRRPP